MARPVLEIVVRGKVYKFPFDSTRDLCSDIHQKSEHKWKTSRHCQGYCRSQSQQGAHAGWAKVYECVIELWPSPDSLAFLRPGQPRSLSHARGALLRIKISPWPATGPLCGACAFLCACAALPPHENAVAGADCWCHPCPLHLVLTGTQRRSSIEGETASRSRESGKHGESPYLSGLEST